MTEFEKFDVVVSKLMAVSRKELHQRESMWKEQQAQKKQAKTSPASRASTAKD